MRLCPPGPASIKPSISSSQPVSDEDGLGVDDTVWPTRRVMAVLGIWVGAVKGELSHREK